MCVAPTAATMKNLWNNESTFWWLGIYIGGVNRSCPQPNLSESWQLTVTHETGSGATSGWDLALIWVGDQSRCVTRTLHISPTHRIPAGTTAAFNDGTGAATNAYHEALSLGFGGGAIYFDLEPYNTATYTCLVSARNFISGWDYQLHTVEHWLGAVYALHNEIATFSDIKYVPYAVWPSNQTPTHPGVFTVPNLSSSLWVNHQRLHQCAHTETTTFGGVRYTDDWDCATGPLNGGSNWHVACTKTKPA